MICECAACCKKMRTHPGHVWLSVVAASTKNGIVYKEIYGYIFSVVELTHMCVVCDVYLVQFLLKLLLSRTSSRIACCRFCASEWCQEKCVVNAVLLGMLVRVPLPSMGQAINRQHRSNVIPQGLRFVCVTSPKAPGCQATSSPVTS